MSGNLWNKILPFATRHPDAPGTAHECIQTKCHRNRERFIRKVIPKCRRSLKRHSAARALPRRYSEHQARRRGFRDSLWSPGGCSILPMRRLGGIAPQ